MVSVLDAIILGIIQGVTEWLPISSSAHLALAQYFFEIKASIAFDIILHVGTLLAVFAYYRKDILEMIIGTLHGKENERKLAMMILLASLPTAIIGFAFKDFFESMFSQPLLIAGALAITGLFLIIASKAKQHSNLNTKNSFIVGIAQGIAVAPGISRSGSTIGTALILGIEKTEAAKFSFLAGIIPIIGAAIFEGRKELEGNIEILPAIAGMITAAIIGYVSIAILIKMLKESKLQWFGYYCIVLSAIVALLLLSGF